MLGINQQMSPSFIEIEYISKIKPFDEVTCRNYRPSRHLPVQSQQ